MKRNAKTIVREFLTINATGDEPCERISLHLGNAKSDALLSLKVNGEDFNLEAVIDEILGLVKSDEDDEPATFCLRAESDGGETVRVSKPISSGGVNGNDAEKMLLPQAWRHIEVLTRGIAHMLDSNARVQARRAEIELEGLEKYGELRSRMLIAEQDNADRSHERLLEMKREDRKAEWIDQGMKAVLNCLPMLGGKVGGIIPQGADAIRSSPQYQTLRSLFETQPEANWPNIEVWLRSVPLSPTDAIAFQLVIESVVADMIEQEKEKTNGKTGDKPSSGN